MTIATSDKRPRSKDRSPPIRGSKARESSVDGAPSTRQIAIVAIVSGLLLWAAFPPVGWWPLAWLAPVGWCWLVALPTRPRRFYGLLYLVGVVQALMVMHWVRLPHWSAYFGWLALCGYLGVYLPLFVGLSRSLVHGWRWPLCIACPVAWCGLELARSHVLTGFSMGLLGHTQVHWTTLIQTAALGGAYAVSFLVMFFAASLAQAIQGQKRQPFSLPFSFPFGGSSLRPLGVAGLLVLGAWIYGSHRVSRLHAISDRAQANTVRVALVQGCRDTTFSEADDPDVTLAEYRQLTWQALENDADIDLIVWPESAHTRPWIGFSRPLHVPAEYARDPEAFRQNVVYSATHARHDASWIARQFGTPALVGCAALEFGPEMDRYNRAMWLDEKGRVAGKYDKMHPVMFGEYVPLGNLFPWLYRLTPMGNGVTAGTSPLAISVHGVRISPCICFENTVPHLLRGQVRQLSDEGMAPHALVTISNDGWFWGSSQLDMHLTCGVFRAVELGRPMLIAANTGFSAVIDATGTVQQQGPRRDTAVLVADVAATEPDPTWYYALGDGWVAGCLAVSLCAGIFSWRTRQTGKRAA